MTNYIITNITPPEDGLEEIYELLGYRPTVLMTTERIKPKWNPWHRSMWGDFDWLRSLFPKDATSRCYLTKQKHLTQAGITTHLGMYDVVDGDDVYDFYIGLPTTLDARAKANGFRTNLAWLYCHEKLHGKLAFAGTPDIVHTMEEQGRLKELIEPEVAVSGWELLRDLYVKLKQLLQQQQGLKPLVERKANLVVMKMGQLGHPVRIVEGYRTPARQDELYAQGRTTPGAIVTNARAGESFHNYGVAVDFVFRREGYDATQAQWDLLGKVGKEQGFAWGGDWTGFVDRPHFELTLGYRLEDFQNHKVDYNLFS